MNGVDVKSVVIIDYGVGNLRSIEKALAATGVQARISADEGILRDAEALVLPGVGAFPACMKALKERCFDRIILERASSGTPLLGVCVGMQMLFEESEEFGKSAGLGLLRGRVRKFTSDLVVPHVGWNQVRQTQDHQLLADINDNSFFYFVHSYFCVVDDPKLILGQTEYGDSYASIVAKANISGVQFHPEKSQKAGLRLLRNFAN
jgi:imidazole glycerol-phosphate synthase subunit HisH